MPKKRAIRKSNEFLVRSPNHLAFFNLANGLIIETGSVGVDFFDFDFLPLRSFDFDFFLFFFVNSLSVSDLDITLNQVGTVRTSLNLFYEQNLSVRNMPAGVDKS